MFTSLGLFKDVDCPEILRCSMPNCIFAHRGKPNPKKRDLSASPPPIPLTEPKMLSDEEENAGQVSRPRKRLRTTHQENSAKRISSSTMESSKVSLANLKSDEGVYYGGSSVGTSSQTLHCGPSIPDHSRPKSQSKNKVTTLRREVKHGTAVIEKIYKPPKPAQKIVQETLNPRILPKPPASHAIRYKLISLLHEYMTKLNDAILKSDDPAISANAMTSEEIVKEVLDEEERVATNQPSIYGNILKRRVSTLKKMGPEEFSDERQKKKDLAKPRKEIPKSIELSPREQIEMLKFLYNKDADLIKYNYTLSPPTKNEMELACQGVEAAKGWEICDRCSKRFQVFPGRREDGALTTGSPCHYHHSKAYRNKASRSLVHRCCGQEPGKPGCTLGNTHVFKIEDHKRLASILPFVETPTNPTLGSNNPVSIDCEMGYTTIGFECLRTTATTWPSGNVLFDVLIRPQGEILDLNTRFSGVDFHHFENAIPYFQSSPIEPIAADLNIGQQLSHTQLSLAEAPVTKSNLNSEVSKFKSVSTKPTSDDSKSDPNASYFEPRRSPGGSKLDPHASYFKPRFSPGGSKLDPNASYFEPRFSPGGSKLNPRASYFQPSSTEHAITPLQSPSTESTTSDMELDQKVSPPRTPLTEPATAVTEMETKVSPPFKVVDSVADARRLLFRYISSDTPLIGHALNNDLTTLRVIHPTILDTAILFPHFMGLPHRTSLKVLATNYLSREIQTGGDEGHDSKEDANAAGQLVELRVKNEWRYMQNQGWTLVDGKFIPPPKKKPSEISETLDS